MGTFFAYLIIFAILAPLAGKLLICLVVVISTLIEGAVNTYNFFFRRSIRWKIPD
jgi:hypothetical protein